jgi:hypothetical protein
MVEYDLFILTTATFALRMDELWIAFLVKHDEELSLHASNNLLVASMLIRDVECGLDQTWFSTKRIYNGQIKFTKIFMKKSLKIPKGNQNPYIEEEQTTQWLKDKVQKDKQRSTKHS